MNNEEPELTQIANLQIAHAGHKLPEQADVSTLTIPRPFSFSHLINQWQPMGIRVVLNIPFIGNDRDYLFAIRNGPFIPRLNKSYTDYSPVSSSTTTSKQVYDSYAWNNMRNVLHAKPEWAVDNDTKDSIYITQYDYPPPLAQFATMFRKWRGTMHYRIRTVAGFTTQGYPFVSMIKNMPSAIGIYDEFKVLPSVQRQDASYREAMLNAYIMGDTAMVRHFEFTVPYEYPTPWYDQFAWISRRSRPALNFHDTGTPEAPGTHAQISPLVNEPHGDNYIVVGLRGSLNTSVNTAQISFELEYRAGEDFQFSDPGLPLGDFLQPRGLQHNSQGIAIRQVPSKDYTSDGLGVPKRTKTARSATVRANDDYEARMAEYNRRLKQRQEEEKKNAARRTRSIDEVDEGSDAESVVSDISDIESLGRPNLRKSLRMLNL